MKLESNQGRIASQLITLVIVGHVSSGIAASTEERPVLRGTGIVLLQVSAESVVSSENMANASANLHLSGDGHASLPKPLPRRHGRESHTDHNVAPGQNHTLWRQFIRIQTGSKDGTDGGTIALGCVVVVVVVILGIFIASETSPPRDDNSLKTATRRRSPSNTSTPPSKMSAPAAAHAPPSSSPPATSGPPAGTAALAPPSSLKARFQHEAPMSRGSSFDAKAESQPFLPAMQTVNQSSTQGHAQQGQMFSAQGSGQPPMATMGATPAGSASRMPPSSGGGAAPGGPLVAPHQMLTDSSMGQPNDVAKPPPVCKELVLPHCEAWFAVEFEKLDSVNNGDFDLYGLSGKPLLRTTIETGPSIRKMSISMKPPKSPTLGSIEMLNPTSGINKMQIKSKNDELYGEFIKTGDMHFVVMKSGGTPSELLSVQFDKNNNALNLTSSIDGSSLARATRNTTSEIFHDKEHLEVRVNQGVDAVLSLLCVLAVVLFTQHSAASLA